MTLPCPQTDDKRPTKSPLAFRFAGFSDVDPSNKTLRDAATKILDVALIFWIIKIAATTPGETGGDSVTMTLNWA